jgi:hypothetical protein
MTGPQLGERPSQNCGIFEVEAKISTYNDVIEYINFLSVFLLSTNSASRDL